VACKSYVWGSDDDLDYSANKIYAQGDSCLGAKNGGVTGAQLKSFFQEVKGRIKQIVIWSTEDTDILEYIDDSVMGGFPGLTSLHVAVPVQYLGDGLFKNNTTIEVINFLGGV
jgi:hypothetical protein